ncbi:MAG: hypothetical protein CYPHOPRED_003109, partial [Cyphobasidiales sp. Tagirdzhanova-0007]
FLLLLASALHKVRVGYFARRKDPIISRRSKKHRLPRQLTSLLTKISTRITSKCNTICILSHEDDVPSELIAILHRLAVHILSNSPSQFMILLRTLQGDPWTAQDLLVSRMQLIMCPRVFKGWFLARLLILLTKLNLAGQIQFLIMPSAASSLLTCRQRTGKMSQAIALCIIPTMI